MKVIENILVFEDFNYVAGNLELKISGTRFFESNTKEQFTADSILSAKFYVEEKFIAPNVPGEIKNDKSFVIPLLFDISTQVKENGKTKNFLVKYDKLICADKYVTDDGYLKVDRYNTVKDGNQIFSTVTLKAYGLKKKRREEIEKIAKYEIFPSVIGSGEIVIEPDKEYYDIGEKVLITAVSKYGKFIGWENDFETTSNEKVSVIIAEDLTIKAVFTVKTKSVTSQSKEGLKSLFKPKSIIDYTSTSFNTKNNPKAIPDSNGGCIGGLIDAIALLFTLVGFLFYGAIILGLLLVIFNIFGFWTIAIIGLIALLYFYPRIFNFLLNPQFWSGIFNLLFIFIAVGGLLFFLNNFNNNHLTATVQEKLPVLEEIINEDRSTTFSHTLYWEDYEENSYTATLSVISDYVRYEQNIKDDFGKLYDENDYNRLLRTLYNKSDESLSAVYAEAVILKKTHKLNKKKFAEVLVSMVQQIPYYAIVPETCDPLAYVDADIRKLLLDSPCQGYVAYGIKSPAEFLKDLKGDCDTRTLFLYRLLSHFDYDVVVLGSEYYKHSILGITMDDPSINGVYKKIDNKKYFVWETTAPSVRIGELSTSIANMNYWNVNLKE